MFVSSILGICEDPTVLQNNEYSTFEQELYRLMVVRYCNTVILTFLLRVLGGCILFRGYATVVRILVPGRGTLGGWRSLLRFP